MMDGNPSCPDGPSSIEQLPAELRLKIFGYALQCDYSVTRYDFVSDNIRTRLQFKRANRVNTALLTVSRQVSNDAQEAFWIVNTIRFRRWSLDVSKLSRARHLVLGGTLTFDLCWRTPAFLSTLFELASTLPKLQTITVPCDELRSPADHYPTVRSLLSQQTYGADVNIACPEIGLYKLTPSPSYAFAALQPPRPRLSIYFEKVTLREMLPLTRHYATTLSTDRLLGLRQGEERRQGNRDTFSRSELIEFESIRAAKWLHCYEALRAVRRGDSNAGREIDMLAGEDFLPMERFGWSDARPWKSELLPDDLRLIDLIEGNPKDFSPDLLEWATEMLGWQLCLRLVTSNNSTRKSRYVICSEYL